MDSPRHKQLVPPQSAAPGDISRLGPGETVISVWQQPPRKEGGLYPRVGKRIIDTVGALIGLAVTSPVLLLCAVAVRLDSRGPIFFRQRRVGQYGRTFRIFKFRTMIDGTDKNGTKLTAFGDARITRVGKILRKTKLDEIPQLLNVVRG